MWADEYDVLFVAAQNLLTIHGLGLPLPQCWQSIFPCSCWAWINQSTATQPYLWQLQEHWGEWDSWGGVSDFDIVNEQRMKRWVLPRKLEVQILMYHGKLWHLSETRLIKSKYIHSNNSKLVSFSWQNLNIPGKDISNLWIGQVSLGAHASGEVKT